MSAGRKPWPTRLPGGRVNAFPAPQSRSGKSHRPSASRSCSRSLGYPASACARACIPRNHWSRLREPGAAVRMSLRGKDFRCEIAQEMHEKLRIMTAFKNAGAEMAAEGARLLEKAIRGGNGMSSAY